MASGRLLFPASNFIAPIPQGTSSALATEPRSAVKVVRDRRRALKARSMTDRLKIAFAQMNQRVGDLEGNAAAMLDMRRQARQGPIC